MLPSQTTAESLSHRRRLLIPIFHQTPQYSSPSPSKTGGIRHGRNRGDSVSSVGQPPKDTAWFSKGCNWDVLVEEMEVDGFQIYAVEKWIVQRTTPVVWLTVYTGDSKDKITVAVMSPPSSLSDTEAQREWDKVQHELRLDGARAHETGSGVIMVTSLANFRSDYTIVHIPGGDFRVHRERLYMNINLLRMGCSGRSALSLQEPSDSTKDRFLTTYRFRDTMRPLPLFTSTVLALVALVQVGLAIFDMFSPLYEEHNGLLCDVTVDGIRRWVTQVGEPYLKVEPSERVADPLTVSALFSVIVSMRHKLNAISSSLAMKDPFIDPFAFMHSVATFANGPVHSRHQSPVIPSSTSASPLGSSSSTNAITPLTMQVIRRIDVSFEKIRSSDGSMLPRVFRNKLDEIGAAAGSVMSTAAAASHTFAPHGNESTLASYSSGSLRDLAEPSLELAIFVRKVTHASGKEAVDSMRCLWAGRLSDLDCKRREAARAVYPWSDAEQEDELERSKQWRNTHDDGDMPVSPWPNKVRKGLENWAGRSKKKASLDASSHHRVRSGSPENNLMKSSPTVIISADPMEPTSGLSSGQASPAGSGHASPSKLAAVGSLSSAQASSVHMDVTEYERRMLQFTSAQRPVVSPTGSRAVSWSDTRDATQHFPHSGIDSVRFASTSVLAGTEDMGSPVPQKPIFDDIYTEYGLQSRASFIRRLKRHCSEDDISFLNEDNILDSTEMEIDVELAGQCLTMRRRRLHVESSIAILQVVLQTVTSSNDFMRQALDKRQEALQNSIGKVEVVTKVDQAREVAGKVARDTDALEYESMGFNVRRLWQQAAIPRHRVFEIRKRVTGARLAGSADLGQDYPVVHDQFNRIQTGLDGRERLVDWMGRSEHEVDEESDLPEIVPMDGEGSQDGVPHYAARRLGPTNGWFLDLFTRWGKSLGMGGRIVQKDDDRKRVDSEKDK